MTKPSDIPEEVWEEARIALFITEEADYMAVVMESVSRAIMAAEKRGADRERAECASIVDAVPIGGLLSTNETDLKRLWRQAGTAQAAAIASAIRNRTP